jgi:hypothetical protein
MIWSLAQPCVRLPRATPRRGRLDAPATIHHVMVRDLERRPIFQDDAGRAHFVARLAAVAVIAG